VKGDSHLIIKQVKGECCCNDPQLAAYLLHVRKLEKDFKVLELHHIPRAENAQLMICQQSLPPGPQSQMVSLKDGYNNRLSGQPNRVKGARPAPRGWQSLRP
jgi:hypothetical protein